MTNCNFTNALPDYVLDRTIIINENHEHRVSGFKLAKASNFFKRRLVNLRQGELAKSKEKDGGDQDESSKQTSGRRIRAHSLCEMELLPLKIEYNDIYGLEMVLTFIHLQNDSKTTILNDYYKPNVAKSILTAALHFEVQSLINAFCDSFLENMLSADIWSFWEISEELCEELPRLKEIIGEYIDKNLLDLSSKGEFLRITFPTFKQILRSDCLDVKHEIDLLSIVDKWIAYNPVDRKVQCSELISCLRLGRMSAEDLLEVARNRYVESTIEQCSTIITMAHVVREKINSSVRSKKESTGDEQDMQNYMGRPRTPHSAIFVIGGWEGNQDDPNFGPSKALQIYNIRANHWRRFLTEGVALDEGHAYSGCVIHDESIFLIGGYISTGPTQTLKVFNTTSKKWRYLSPMHEKRNYICCCLCGDKIYVMGGHNGKQRLDSVEVYDIKSNSWSFVSPMKQVRSDAGSDSLNGKIYVIGGFDGHHFYDSCERFDPAINQWTFMANMQNIRSGVCCLAVNEHLYSIGGNDGLQRLRTVERYDPETNQWQIMPQMIRQRSNFCVSLLDEVIFVMGGWSDETNSTISLVEKWDPKSNVGWQPVKELFLPASANCCCTVKELSLIKDFL